MPAKSSASLKSFKAYLNQNIYEKDKPYIADLPWKKSIKNGCLISRMLLENVLFSLIKKI